ncbi:hypothetical protein KY289_009948 [Solanum tuberosum]|nr:hypothetical protein KY289_009948 [Solanum tuberosum]
MEEYKRKLGMKYALANGNGKIWAFIDEAMNYTVIRDEEQMLTLKLQSQGMDLEMVVSLVYAKCTQSERLQLWDSMETIASSTNLPWLVGRDFNVISNAEEKLGGRSVPESEVEDFNHCTNVCNLDDQGFKGSKYTWWNGRTDANCIFKRLDRILGSGIQNIFPILEVEHLVRSGSDHTPLLITFNTSNANVVRPFKFLNFWLKEESFMEVVKKHWEADFEGDPFSLYHYKLKQGKESFNAMEQRNFWQYFPGNNHFGGSY